MLQFYALPFQESVFQYSNPEISKLHSPNRMFSTVHVLILEPSVVPKILFFVSVASHKHPLSRSFTNTHVPDHSLEVGHPTL